jgi:hypothetical protein
MNTCHLLSDVQTDVDEGVYCFYKDERDFG